jgi:hypothetical protein
VKLGYFALSSIAYALAQVYNAEIVFAGCVFILFSLLVRLILQSAEITLR